MESFYLIVIVVSLTLSFFFSGTETAFVSVNKVRVEVWRRQRRRVARHILKFLKKPERFLYTTLVGNNISNIAFASFATVYFDHFLQPGFTWLIIVLLSIFVGEILPKTFFRSMADWMVRRIVYPLEFFYRAFYPIILLVSKIAESLLRMLGYQAEELERFFSRKDIEILLHESQQIMKKKRHQGRQETEFLVRLLDLRELPVREIMIPRTEIEAISENVSIKEVIHKFQNQKYTRLPVFRGTLDNIVGVIHVKDIFQQPAKLQQIIRPIMFVPETKRALDLLNEFRQNNTSMAVVVDEYGGTAGLVTMEDIIEELFGEIEDEFDVQMNLIHKINNTTYSVNARIEVDLLNEQLGLNIPRGDYETLAGFLLSRFGHIPRRREKLEYQGAVFTVTRATRRKIEMVKIELPHQLSASEEAH